MAYGTVTMHLRTREFDPELGLYRDGPWTSFAFSNPEPPAMEPAGVHELELLNDTGPSATDWITSDPTLTGTVVAGAAAGIVVQFDHDGDVGHEGSTVTDRDGVAD